jgi:hypothetical protein
MSMATTIEENPTITIAQAMDGYRVPRVSASGPKRIIVRFSKADLKRLPRRGSPGSAIVTDEISGKQYRYSTASCGAPHCMCDAVVKEVK